MPRLVWVGLLLVLAAAVALVGVPIYLLWPFKPQGPSFVPWAWTLRREWAPAGTAGLALILLGGLYVGWKRTRWPGKSALALMALAGVAVAWFAHQNHFEWMFNPIAVPRFDVGAKAPGLDPDDLVLGVVIKDDAAAFPVRRIGYHHVTNVTVGGEPIVVSYCTLCHTGTIFRRRLNGLLLTFRLIGINNQNALLEDIESRSWWQQASGEAIAGPLKGMRLEPLLHDEVSYALWAREYPHTKVLARVDPELDIDKGWEDRMDRVPTVVPAPPNDPLHRRSYVVGIVVNGKAKAYPKINLAPNSLRGPNKPAMTYAVMDRVGGVPVAVLVGGDGISIRAFDRRIDGRELELVTKFGSSPARFIDAQTGSEWDISGTAVSGPMAGQRFERIPSTTEFWFDWQLRHPDTVVHTEWQPRPSAPARPEPDLEAVAASAKPAV
jgi:hypothetical protein